MSEQGAQIPAQTRLPSCPERSVGLSLPVPINARIDLLVQLAEQAGELDEPQGDRRRLHPGAPDGAEELVRWLRIYRSSPAESVYTSGPKLADVLELKPAPPGPRPRPWRHRPPPA